MFTKNNLKYILILGLGFLWCSSIYLTQEQYLLKFLDYKIVNIIDMLFGSFSMALGILLFSVLYKNNKDIKKIYIIFLIISLLFSLLFFITKSTILMAIFLCLICFMGSAGFGCAYHFSLISIYINKKYRGRVFAIGYSFGTIFTYIISLLPKKIIYDYKSLIIYIPLILMNIFLIFKYGNLKKIDKNTPIKSFKNYYNVICILVLLMAIITSFSSNLFSLKNIKLTNGFAYPRIYYSIGLIIAGYLIDKKNEYLEVSTIISLFFPLLSVLLLKENIDTTLLASLNYVFISFFVVYRTINFMNLKDKNNNLIYLSAIGLCITRIVEGFLVFINLFITFNYLVLIIFCIIILSIILMIYILYFCKNYSKNDDEILNELILKYKLSIQEKNVLELLLKDFTNQEIADNLYLSVNTIRNHVANIYKKTNMKKKELKEFYIKKTI